MNLNNGGWASPLLRLVARLRSDGINSTTPVTEINGGTISATDADVALVAKGTGATLAQVPDGTVAGGNKRGTYATDLQKIRDASVQVASGIASVVTGGNRNRATGLRSAVLGGFQNSANGQDSTACGGNQNTASGSFSCIGGGNTNTASSDYSFVGGGQSNIAQTNTHATVCGGSGNAASGLQSFVGGGVSNVSSVTSSVVCGGSNNTANGDFSAIFGGRRGIARSIVGYHVFPACSVPIAATDGVTQSALLLLGRETTTATATVLTSNSSAASTTNQVILPNNSAYSFSGEVIAGVTGGGDTARWTINGAIKRGANAASTAMVGIATVTMTHTDAGAAAWTVAVTADTTNGGIAVTVTGAAATTIRWVAKINTTEMTY